MHGGDHDGVLPHGSPVVRRRRGPLQVSEALALAHPVAQAVHGHGAQHDQVDLQAGGHGDGLAVVVCKGGGRE